MRDGRSQHAVPNHLLAGQHLIWNAPVLGPHCITTSQPVTMCDADYATARASKAHRGQPGSVCGFPVEIMRALLQYVEIMPTLCDDSLNAVHAPVPCKLVCWSTLQLFIQ